MDDLKIHRLIAKGKVNQVFLKTNARDNFYPR